MTRNQRKKIPSILVVDDEKDIRDLIAGLLRDASYDVTTAHDDHSTFAAIRKHRPSLLLLDIWLDGSQKDGMQIFDMVRSLHPDMPIILISGHGTIEVAVSAIKKGAYDFIEKPFNSDRLLIALRNAIEAYALREENSRLRAHNDDQPMLIGDSSEMQTMRRRIATIPAQSRVMIVGASGSGKRTVARLLHEASPQSDFPFLNVNCALHNSTDLEIILFGHEKSDSSQIGALEKAHRGTLLLEHIDTIPHAIQNRLLHFITHHHFTRIGGNYPLHTDVRILSSISGDPHHAIASQALRKGLYDRLNIVLMEVPPLARRLEDIPALIAHLTTSVANAAGLSPCQFDDDAIMLLQSYNWPGNVRQLRNMIERLLITANHHDRNIVTAEMIHHDLKKDPDTTPIGGLETDIMAHSLRQARETFEKQYLLMQIRRFDGNISRTAAFVGMERSALHRKLRLLNVDRSLLGN